jgi:hypothetical protein
MDSPVLVFSQGTLDLITPVRGTDVNPGVKNPYRGLPGSFIS